MRVFVFRPQADAERSARALSAHGHEPIATPLFTVVRLPEPAPEGDFAALVLTSGNAVPALADARPAWRELPVFTVGARTAGRTRDAGFGDARSADGDRNDLIALIRQNIAAPARLLLVTGKDYHEDVPARLGEAGYEVTVWTAYAAEAVAALPEDTATQLRDGRAEAALHYSARGAQTFLDLTRKAGLGDPALELTHVALSAEVAAPLIASGASTILVAEYPEEAALLAALDQVSARNRSIGDAREDASAPAGVETDRDAMSEPDKPSTPRGRSRRTPPTIELKAKDDTPAVAADESSPAAAEAAAEALLPTEALPQEVPTAGDVPLIEPKQPVEDAASANAKPDAAQSESTKPGQPAEPRSRLPLPALALAGLVGGVVGAGLVLLALGRSESDAGAQQIAELRTRIDTLQSASANLPTRANLDALERKAGDALQAIDRKASAAADTAARAGAAAQAASAKLAEIANAPAQPAAPDNSAALAGLTQRLGSVETLAKNAATPTPQALAAARIVLAERIQNAIASGQPFAGDVAALAKGGGAPDQLAALNAVAASGAPTQAALLAQFRSHQVMFVREMTPASASWQDRLLGLASRVVTIRPVGETGDKDPGTLVIRLESAIARNTIGTAATLWAQLPEPARQASAEFGEALQKRAAAEAAIAKIAQDAVAALGAGG
ncbi:uroporphyrinogen-III synthase [Bosea caraganae]|nr:uroporphyrinogen-III synthase [Bosea caraganae]